MPRHALASTCSMSGAQRATIIAGLGPVGRNDSTPRYLRDFCGTTHQSADQHAL